MSGEIYALLVLLHLLLFVYWLGADIGVFYSARYVQDTTLTLESRRTALRIMGWVDQLPRYSLVLMLPVGTTLGVATGVIALPGSAALVTWLIGAGWLWFVWAIHHHQGTPLAERLRSQGPLVADWISIKVALFGVLVFCGIMIRMRGKPIGPALRKILSEGSSPELEAELVRGFERTRPFILGIWFLLLVAAFVGLAKPNFG
ncbi:MAG: hypothetical protein LW820_06610 [Acidibacter sp.]|nr:hypothetical protein [Acidibacter sp.]